MRRRIARLGVLLFFTIVAPFHPASAHGMRTAYLEMLEQQPGTALVLWKVPIEDDSATPRFSAECELSPNGEGRSPNIRSYLLKCEGGIAGKTLEVSGLGPVLNDVVVRVGFADGRSASRVLTPSKSTWCLPVQETGASVAREYVALGVEHILTGTDHLLFLLALVLLLRRPRAVLLAETAFTLSHSLTYSATALGLLRVSSGAAEACIALSLVLVALDVARDDRPAPSTAQGATMAFIFGLVHGLGFAGSLSEVGLPDQAVAAALIGFAAGVELGQVAFLGVVLLGVLSIQRTRALHPVALAGSYLVGITGAYWLFQRLWVCFYA